MAVKRKAEGAAEHAPAEGKALQRAESSSIVELGTVRAADARGLIRAASDTAQALADVVRSRGLSVRVSGREFVKCEGWTTLAAMLGVVPREAGIIEEDGGRRYIAEVELVRIRDGQVIARASAECGADEKRWASMPRYARRSMALTRATSKACRLAFSWVMALAGYDPTPAEEMDFAVAEPVPVTATVSPAPPPAPPADEAPRTGATGERTISKAQAKRLWAKVYAAADEVGMGREDVHALVADVLRDLGCAKTEEIPRRDYDAVIETLLGAIHDAAPPAEGGAA